MRDALCAALVGVMALEVTHLFTGSDYARTGAHIAMGAVILAGIPRLGAREAYLLALSALLGLLLWSHHPEPWLTARRAMDQAVFLMAFVLLVSLIQEAASTSASVEKVGRYLARQPGGRRFLAIFGGTMVMAVIFNMSTITLLAPLIRRATEAAQSDPLTPVRERRQLNAHLRGFAWSVVWSPTAIAPVALMGLIAGIDRLAWTVLGLVLSCVMMVVGWAEDRWSAQGRNAAALGRPPVRPAALPGAALARFLAVCAVLAALTGTVMTATGKGVPASLMVSAPILLILWLLAQGAAMSRRLREIATEGLPASASMGVTLAGSGFIGIAAAALLPAEQIAAWIGLDDLPVWIFMLGCTLTVTALSQFGLSPIMMAVFLGAVLGSLPTLPASPTYTALAVAAGWAVSTTISPFASGVIILSRVTGHPGTLLTYRWNAVFTGLSIAVLTVVFAALTALS